jgi:L-fucose isomerase-like protein
MNDLPSDPSRSVPDLAETQRYLIAEPPAHLRRPLARLQPVLARDGKPSVNLDRLADMLQGVAVIEEPAPVRSPEHWQELVLGLDDTIDAILPVSVPAYPTEVWNSHPEPLVARGLPFIFWCLIEREEPDFWRWSARDFLRTLGVDAIMVKNTREGEALVRALALKRFLRESKMVVFGEQNFPWNARAIGHLVTERLGTKIAIRSLDDLRRRYPQFTDERLLAEWQVRRGERYREVDVLPAELLQALRMTAAIRAVLEEERAMGFGVNCFGDLVIRGGRDVPCLAQSLLREEGYIASCDGDFIAMMSMVLTSFYLDKPCMMSNMYPISYVGALSDHFGDPLAPPEEVSPSRWSNLARLNHCGFVGIVPPEMSPQGRAELRDWGGTFEIKRDGRGCGFDADLAPGLPVTVVELCFDAHRLLVAEARVVETSRHHGMPHCESSALLEFRDLPGFVEQISREHTVILYGDHSRDFQVLAEVLGLDARVF